ncbi:MAG: ferritin [Erysipelotrichaceae bacterium]|nr:MAG: hypothetical protein FD179_782 [Erysipelotrichaceae bacterium]TXT16620.1 MAG: ferritin [Erysipelotrichaceae bacterium]
MKKELVELVTDQINFELESAYLYLSMATWFVENGYPGSGKWMEKQANEEVGHAMKMTHYLQEVNVRVLMRPIAAGATEFPSFLEVFKLSLEHEKKVSARIAKIYEAAVEAKDHALASLYLYFVNEQVEEEAQLVDIITRLEKVPTPIGIMMMDDRLGNRA